jgi:hypothetical protein
MTDAQRFFGKYRGIVVNNIDPLQIGRIQAMVPDVSTVTLTSWCMPCVPIAGKQMGTYMVPQIGAGVWIEFEQGDPDYPIWVGGFWGNVGEVPAPVLLGNPVSPSIVLQSALQNAIIISDLPGPTGGITIKCATGAMILVNDLGITITNGKGATITMVGPSVDVNLGALTIL